MGEMKPHTRVNDILLGPLERPALQWLAARMPAWVNPDILTGIGIIGTVITFAAYWLSGQNPAFLWLASLGLVINWFGDSLDGTLARFRKIERPRYGFFVDHTVDAVAQFLIVMGLGLSPYVTFAVACLALIAYLMMSLYVYIRTYIDGVFKISYGKMGPTEARVVIILVNAAMFFVGNPTVALPLGLQTVWDVLVALIALALFALYLVSAAQQARVLYRLGE